MTLPKTVVCMIYAGPDGAAYGVYRARVRFKSPRQWSWNANARTTERVGVVRIGPSMGSPDYTELARRFATQEWPALEH